MAKRLKTLLISYEHHTGGQIADNKLWMGVIEGEIDVWDWNSKAHLKRNAEAEGRKWKVIRRHNNGKISIMEESK